MTAPHVSPEVLPSHRVPAHLARRFNQICLGVTAEILNGEGLTPLLFGVLAAVLEEPGRGQKQVAERMGVDAVNFGQMIDELEGKGLVERKVDPDDRRLVRGKGRAARLVDDRYVALTHEVEVADREVHAGRQA